MKELKESKVIYTTEDLKKAAAWVFMVEDPSHAEKISDLLIFAIDKISDLEKQIKELKEKAKKD